MTDKVGVREAPRHQGQPAQRRSNPNHDGFATDTDTVNAPASLVFDPGLESGDWGISVTGHGLMPGATTYACENGLGCFPQASGYVPDANGDFAESGPIFACGMSAHQFPIYFETLTAAGAVIDSNQVTGPPC